MMRWSRRGDERGAVAVMIAIVLVLLMSMAAFALDTGNGWQTRRGLITATDAAALAAAETYAENGNGCSGVPSTFVALNAADASVTACTFRDLGTGAGAVTVGAETPVHFTFAGIMGFDDRVVHSTTTAAYGQPLGIKGLRPFGLCNMSTGYQDWLTWRANDNPNPFTVTINYGKNAPGDCGANVPGNWGVLDFNGGANSNNDTKDWVENGYPETVTAPSPIPGDPGAFSNSLSSALDTLVDGDAFSLPVFKSASGNGNNASFDVIGFVSVVLVAYKATGPAADRWLKLQFVSDVVQGTCCAHGADTGTRVVFICAVDATFPESNCTDR